MACGCQRIQNVLRSCNMLVEGRKNIVSFLLLIVKTRWNFPCLKTNHATMWSIEQQCLVWSSPADLSLITGSGFGLLSYVEHVGRAGLLVGSLFTWGLQVTSLPCINMQQRLCFCGEALLRIICLEVFVRMETCLNGAGVRCSSAPGLHCVQR